MSLNIYTIFIYTVNNVRFYFKIAMLMIDFG